MWVELWGIIALLASLYAGYELGSWHERAKRRKKMHDAAAQAERGDSPRSPGYGYPRSPGYGWRPPKPAPPPPMRGIGDMVNDAYGRPLDVQYGGRKIIKPTNGIKVRKSVSSLAKRKAMKGKP